jgi:hypothetical protein
MDELWREFGVEAAAAEIFWGWVSENCGLASAEGCAGKTLFETTSFHAVWINSLLMLEIEDFMNS